MGKRKSTTILYLLCILWVPAFLIMLGFMIPDTCSEFSPTFVIISRICCITYGFIFGSVFAIELFYYWGSTMKTMRDYKDIGNCYCHWTNFFGIALCLCLCAPILGFSLYISIKGLTDGQGLSECFHFNTTLFN